MKEIVLLVEPDGASEKLRPRVLEKLGIYEIIERCTLGDDHCWNRIWHCTNDERAITGQRIFREVVIPFEPEPEDPIFDELVVKKPLPFTWRDKT